MTEERQPGKLTCPYDEQQCEHPRCLLRGTSAFDTKCEKALQSACQHVFSRQSGLCLRCDLAEPEERQPDEVLRGKVREFAAKNGALGADGYLAMNVIGVKFGGVVGFAAAFAQSIQADAGQQIEELGQRNCEIQDDIASIVSTHRTDWSWQEVIEDVRNLRDALAATQQARAEEHDARKAAEQQLAEARAALKQVANCSCEEGHTCVRVARELAQKALEPK